MLQLGFPGSSESEAPVRTHERDLQPSVSPRTDVGGEKGHKRWQDESSLWEHSMRMTGR